MPVWVGREGDRLLVCTSEGSPKGRNTRRDPRVALSIVDFHDPYEEVQLRGRVVERRPDPALELMDPVSHKYIGLYEAALHARAAPALAHRHPSAPRKGRANERAWPSGSVM